MKISKGAITITDVPGIEKITVGPRGTAVIKGDSWDREWTVDELTALRDALTLAIAMATDMKVLDSEHAAQFVPREPRVFNTWKKIPFDVMKVSDKDGDVWTRGSDRWTSPNMDEMPIGYIVDRWGPVTEVID